jgi:cytochrome P450
MYPVFPMMARMARKDTTLPVGGGPKHDQPIFVPKGTQVLTCFYTLHRDPAVFASDDDAEDVETFRPERWTTITPKQWEYMTFGGGQRACLGREKVLAEAAFVICRLAQSFGRIESRDTKPWKEIRALGAKNANGCKVALFED